jgi:uncharacterized membrane protein YfcA
VTAVTLALAAPRIARFVTSLGFHLAAFLTGVYAGFFGAGIGVLLIALLRLKFTGSHEIAHVKIQARFVEFLMAIVAVATHITHDNIIASIWIPWSAGAVIGGYAGGIMLKKLGRLPGSIQEGVLYAGFGLALLISGYRAFTG